MSTNYKKKLFITVNIFVILCGSINTYFRLEAKGQCSCPSDAYQSQRAIHSPDGTRSTSREIAQVMDIREHMERSSREAEEQPLGW